jgi:hypothetical protein
VIPSKATASESAATRRICLRGFPRASVESRVLSRPARPIRASRVTEAHGGRRGAFRRARACAESASRERARGPPTWGRGNRVTTAGPLRAHSGDRYSRRPRGGSSTGGGVQACQTTCRSFPSETNPSTRLCSSRTAREVRNPRPRTYRRDDDRETVLRTGAGNPPPRAWGSSTTRIRDRRRSEKPQLAVG